MKKDEEKILIIKTSVQNQDKLEKFIKTSHPYTTPEIIYIKPQAIEQNYLKWLI
ncbi:MAG: divalent cation tolerance protein CutA [Patescibacteria group bacterium]